MGLKLKGVTVIKYNIVDELEKFLAGKKTAAGVETLLHITSSQYLENHRGAQKRATRIRRAQRSRAGNVIQFPRLG
jgi:hypothetical protein